MKCAWRNTQEQHEAVRECECEASSEHYEQLN